MAQKSKTKKRATTKWVKAKKKSNRHQDKVRLKPVHKAMLKAVDKVWEWQNAPYDGVMGMLPEWVPDPEKNKFEDARESLLEKYPNEKILEYMDLRRVPGDTPWIPREIWGDIDSLNRIQELVNLRKKEGFKAYLGKGGYEVCSDLVASENQQKTAKKPRAKPLHDLIERIIKENPKIGWKDVSDELESEAHREIIHKINNEKEKIEWFSSKNKKRTIKFSTLRSLLSKMRKKVNLH